MNKLADDNKINYPRFIIDKPEGKDLYEGKSQERIVENIVQFIKENGENKRKVIGIEGEWGSGKSNVIEILREKLKKEYYFFIFDAWGHQEDLTRRSILEGLLIKIIKDKILDGKTEKWEIKLKNLLSKKIEKQSKNIPKISWAILFSILGIIFTPITKFLAETYLKNYSSATTHPNFCNYLIATGIMFITFIPLGAFIIYNLSIKKNRKPWREFAGELFHIYKGKEIENTTEETISENEPTVFQFTTFLRELEKDSNKRLVIVFDNMDRLPSDKVKEIWSSIHTFFASEDNDLETWAIVPFDNDHICNIFIEDNEKNDNNGQRHRSDSYIHKTFSIVFHVSPPVISDWKRVLASKFTEAFNYTMPIDQNLDTIFDYFHTSDPKIKPRDIICYINDLVALKKLWTDEIPFKYLALFSLKRSEIMKNPFVFIPSKSYLESLNSLFEFDNDLDKYISVLAFNVSSDKAVELLLKRPIEQVLQGEGNLSIVSQSTSFFSVFDNVFYSHHNPDVIHVFNCLDNLKDDVKKKTEMLNYWDKISDWIIKISLFDIKYVDLVTQI